MALNNKDMTPPKYDSTMAVIQASSFYEHTFGGPETPDKPCGLPKNLRMTNPSSSVSEQGHYGNFTHANTGSFLSFEQITKPVKRNLFPNLIGNNDQEEYPLWDEVDLHHSHSTYNQLISPKCDTTAPPEASSSHHAAAAYGPPSGGGTQFGWLINDQETITELGRQESSNNKRPFTGDSVQAMKKQCTMGSSSSSGSKKPKSMCPSPSKDPQSMAAKNRRERISERLKVLQDLVPNGTKVDLVTMLEKAISYVKFLQLQVKVLATDEFWPAPGGKAPDLTQVKEAIDAILASQRDTNSSTTK